MSSLAIPAKDSLRDAFGSEAEVDEEDGILRYRCTDSAGLELLLELNLSWPSVRTALSLGRRIGP